MCLSTILKVVSVFYNINLFYLTVNLIPLYLGLLNVSLFIFIGFTFVALGSFILIVLIFLGLLIFMLIFLGAAYLAFKVFSSASCVLA